MLEVNEVLRQRLIDEGIYSEDLIKKIIEKGSLKDINAIPSHIKKVFVCAQDIEPEWHVRIQAAFQRHVDNAVSKTVNMSNNATVDEVRTVYEQAYKLGCKGVTIYRDGSRDEQVLSIGTGNNSKELPVIDNTPKKRSRPKVTNGVTEKVAIGCGKLLS